MKVLLNSFHLNVYSLGFHTKTLISKISSKLVRSSTCSTLLKGLTHKETCSFSLYLNACGNR